MSIRRHTAYNVLGAVVPAAISLVTVPAYIRLIGEARYGVLAIAWLLLGYFGLFDLGLGQAAGQRIAKLERSGAGERAKVFWTALAMNAALGVLGAALLWPVATYVLNHMGTDRVLRNEMLHSIPWLMTAVPVATVSSVLTGALQGRRQFFEINLIAVVSSTVGQILPLCIAFWLGVALPDLIASVVFARVLGIVASFWRCVVQVPAHPLKLSRQAAGYLLRFGGWVTISSIVGPLMVVLDRFVIGWKVGADGVAYYTVPFQIAERFLVLAVAMGSALFPHIAASSERERHDLLHSTMEALACLITPVAVAGVLAIKPFLAVWIKPEFAAEAGLPAQLLIFAFWINSLSQIPYSQLRASGRPDLVAKCHAGELLPYLGVLYVAVKFTGLPGAAVAFLLRVAADCALLTILAGASRSLVSSLLLQAAIPGAAVIIANVVQPFTCFWWAVALSLLAVSLAQSWSTAPPPLRRALHQLLPERVK